MLSAALVSAWLSWADMVSRLSDELSGLEIGGPLTTLKVRLGPEVSNSQFFMTRDFSAHDG